MGYDATWLGDVVSDPEFDRAYVKARGFYGFFELAWDYIEPSQPYTDNWHIERICKSAEDLAIKKRQGKGGSLVVAVPPGSTKSNILSICYQPWVWTFWPGSRWITATYEAGLSHTFARKARELMQTEWYQERWPLEFKKETDAYFDNVYGGTRVSLGTGGTAIGKHAHFLLGDDLIKEQDARQGSPMMIARRMEEASSFFHSTLRTRAIGDPVQILVGQRLHTNDPPGVAVRKYGYKSQVFPVHFNLNKADPGDPRKTPNELLCPQRMNEEQFKDVTKELTHAQIQAQYEQNPVPPGGRLLKTDYFTNRYERLPLGIKQTILRGRIHPGQIWGIYWDMTFKGKEISDFVCGQVWCKLSGEYYFVDMVHKRMGFNDSVRAVRTLAKEYPFIRGHYIEDAANGPAIQEALKEEIPGIQLLPHGGGTLVRTQATESIWESGNIRLPANEDKIQVFLTEHLSYDGSGVDHDDTVSASSLAILHLSSKTGAAAFLDAMDKVMRCR